MCNRTLRTKEAVANAVCDLTVVLKSEIKSRTSHSVLSRARYGWAALLVQLGIWVGCMLS